jgi:hypothetical protein
METKISKVLCSPWGISWLEKKQQPKAKSLPTQEAFGSY